VKYEFDPNQEHWPRESSPVDILGYMLPRLGQSFKNKADYDWKENGSFEAFD
jgi:hypothetical protein